MHMWHCLADWLADWLADQLTDWLAGRLTDCLAGRLTDWLAQSTLLLWSGSYTVVANSIGKACT